MSDSWLEEIEKIAFDDEMEKLSDSPVYPEDRTVSDEHFDNPEENDSGFTYHSNDGIKKTKTQEIKNELVRKYKKKRLHGRVK